MLEAPSRLVDQVDPSPGHVLRMNRGGPTREFEVREDGRVLLGRTLETEALMRSLEEDRLVTLVGPGGVGKTTLARHVFADLADLAGSRTFVDLTELPPSGLLAGIAEIAGHRTFDRLIDDLAEQPWLLVLDNCEHLLDPVAAVIETLLQRLHGVQILATSREPIEIAGETVLRLGPLSLEGNPSPAVELFLARSRGQDSTLELTTGVVDQICRVLDGLPLAIEIAAAKTASMTPQEILAGLDQPIDLLENRRHRGPDRHGSVRAAIAWSYELLDQDEQRALESLSVFEGSFSEAMADAAVGAESREVLNALVDRSLLLHDPERTESWYRMLQTIRAFGQDRLDETSGRADKVWSRVNEATLLELESLPLAPTHIPTMVKRGFPTIRRAFKDLLMRSDDPKRVFRLVAHLWWLEDIGHQSEGARIVEMALERWPEPNPHSAIGYGVLAGFQRFAGDLAGARESARVAIESSNGIGAAFGHRLLGQTARRSGDWNRALEHFEQGSALAREDGVEGFALEIQIHTAMTWARSGEIEKAFGVIEDVVARTGPYPLLGLWARLFQSWIGFGSDVAAAGEIARAILDESSNAEEDPWVTAVAHQHLALHALLSGDERGGREHLLYSLKKFVDISNRSDISLTLLAIAATLNRSGDIVNARRVMASAQEFGTDAAFGAFEEEMFESIGPLPLDIAGAQPLSPAEVIRLFETDDELRDDAIESADSFTRLGDMWRVVFGGQEALLNDSKGMGDIASLLAQPGVEISCLDLMGSPVAPSDAGARSDDHALKQYRRRLAELQEDIDDADVANDPHRADRAREEMDRLLEHVSGAYGLAGRSRTDRDPAEKARSAVTARIRSTIKRIGDAHPALSDHLDQSVKTGRFCVYEPAESRNWEL